MKQPMAGMIEPAGGGPDESGLCDLSRACVVVTVDRAVSMVRDSAQLVGQHAAAVAGAAAGQVQAGVATLRGSIYRGDLRRLTHRLPPAAVAAGIALAGVVIYVASRRRV